MEKLNSFLWFRLQADTRVTRLSPVTCSLSLLPAFECTEHSAPAACMSLLTSHLPGLCLGDYSGIRSVTSL